MRSASARCASAACSHRSLAAPPAPPRASAAPPHPDKRTGEPAEYDAEFSPQQAMDAVVRSANRTLVLVSGGSRAGDEAMLDKARLSAAAGATGLIFGRNVWQRGHEESLKFAGKLQEILAKYPCQSIDSFASRHRSFGEKMYLPS